MIQTGFKNLHDFITMGGYGGYVWSAYGIAAVVLIGNVVNSVRIKRKTLAKVEKSHEKPT